MQKTSRKLLLLLLVVAIGVPTSLTFLGCSSNDESESETKSSVDANMASYITPDAIAAGVIYSRRILTNPDLSFLPLKTVTDHALKEIGIDPTDIELVVVTTSSFNKYGEPEVGVALRMAKPYSLDQLKKGVTKRMEKSTLEGRPCLISENANTPAIYMPDDRTFLIAPSFTLDAMLANHKNPEKGTVRKLIDTIDPDSDIAVVVNAEKLRPMLSAPLAMAELPPNLSNAKRLPELINAVRLQAKVLGSPLLSVEFMTDNEKNATKVRNITQSLVNTGRGLLNDNLEKARERATNPNEKAILQKVEELAQILEKNLKPTVDGKTAKWALTLPREKQIEVFKEINTQLTKAIVTARQAARRVTSAMNLKQIALAMANHEAMYGYFPQRANFDKDGKPLLSWRVRILPFIEEEALYEKFHLDEPWDSPHNKKLIESMPVTYRNPSNPDLAANGKTSYVVPTGPGSIFEGQNKTRAHYIKDGLSNTILAVEINPDKAVIWTKPDDLDYDKVNPMANLGKAYPGGFNAAFADGHVQFLKSKLQGEVLLQLFQMSDGKPINYDDF